MKRSIGFLTALVLALSLSVISDVSSQQQQLGRNEDTAHVSGDSGIASLTRRADSVTTSAGADGDYALLNTDANGRLWANVFGVTQAATNYLTVRVSDGSSYATLGSDYTHDAAMTIATSTGPLQMGRASSTAPSNVTANDDAVAAWYLLNGSAVTNIAAGGTLVTATGSSLNMNCTGGCSGGTQYVEDNASAGGETVTLGGAVRQDALASSTSLDGDFAILKVNSVGALYTAVGAATTGGATNYSTGWSSAAVLTAEIKGSAGQVYDLQCLNNSATKKYVRLYNQTGAPASTDTANIVWRGVIPGATDGAGFVVTFPVGRTFGTGVGIRASGAVADNDTTALAANDLVCNVGYK